MGPGRGRAACCLGPASVADVPNAWRRPGSLQGDGEGPPLVRPFGGRLGRLSCGPCCSKLRGCSRKETRTGRGRKATNGHPGHGSPARSPQPRPAPPKSSLSGRGVGAGPGAKWVFPSPRGAQPPSRSSRLKMLSSKNKGTDKKKFVKGSTFSTTVLRSPAKLQEGRTTKGVI